ncbi:MAG: hypothetical protein LBD20_06055 [Spirochaetaceae bacterium]|nr:hypothetical protein [Spirochaetaceae bacterium]
MGVWTERDSDYGDSDIGQRLQEWDKRRKHPVVLVQLSWRHLLETMPEKRLFAGFDHLGNALEIIANEDAANGLVVFHAMKLRKQFHFLLGDIENGL